MSSSFTQATAEFISGIIDDLFYSYLQEAISYIYKRDTVSRLLILYTKRIILGRDLWYQSFGRHPITETERSDIEIIVRNHITQLLKIYDQYIRDHKSIHISDIRKSAILHNYDLSLSTWDKLAVDIRQVVKTKTLSSDPAITVYQIKEELYNRSLLDSIPYNESHVNEYELTQLYINHTVDLLLYQPKSYMTYPNMNREMIRQHHEAFIDYVIQQFFGEKGYYYKHRYENINTGYRKTGVLPSDEDILGALTARAITESHRGVAKDRDTRYNHIYDTWDAVQVAELNIKYVQEIVLPKYRTKYIVKPVLGEIAPSDIEYTLPSVYSQFQDGKVRYSLNAEGDYVVKSTERQGKIFDAVYPSEDDLQFIYNEINYEQREIVGEIQNRTADKVYDYIDGTDYFARLLEEGQTAASYCGVDESFCYCYVIEGMNNIYNAMYEANSEQGVNVSLEGETDSSYYDGWETILDTYLGSQVPSDASVSSSYNETFDDIRYSLPTTYNQILDNKVKYELNDNGDYVIKYSERKGQIFNAVYPSVDKIVKVWRAVNNAYKIAASNVRNGNADSYTSEEARSIVNTVYAAGKQAAAKEGLDDSWTHPFMQDASDKLYDLMNNVNTRNGYDTVPSETWSTWNTVITEYLDELEFGPDYVEPVETDTLIGTVDTDTDLSDLGFSGDLAEDQDTSGSTLRDIKESVPTGSSTTTIPDTTKSSGSTTQNKVVVSEYARTYCTFSGADMIVTVHVPFDIEGKQALTKVIGNFQMIQYSMVNHKHPVRVIGNMNPKAFVFGPRLCAGRLYLTVFDRHWMRKLMQEYRNETNTDDKSATEKYYMIDELPPFDITISMGNEHGHTARMAIYGVTIVGETGALSINDAYTEEQFEFMANYIDYLDNKDVVQSVVQNNSTSQIPNRPDNDTTEQPSNSQSYPVPSSNTESLIEDWTDDYRISELTDVSEGVDAYTYPEKNAHPATTLEQLPEEVDSLRTAYNDEIRTAVETIMNEDNPNITQLAQDLDAAWLAYADKWREFKRDQYTTLEGEGKELPTSYELLDKYKTEPNRHIPMINELIRRKKNLPESNEVKEDK